jgi:hypothetical protein
VYACAGMLVSHDDLEFVAIFGGREQIELHQGFVLAPDLFADEDEALGRGLRLGFPWVSKKLSSLFNR